MAKKTSNRKSGAAKKAGSQGKKATKPAAKPKPKAKPAPKVKAKPAAKPKPKSKSVAKGKPAAAKAAAKTVAATPGKLNLQSKSPGKTRAGKTASLKISKPPATAIAQHPVEQPEPPTLAELRKAESGLSRQEKEQYRKLLLEKRAEILGDVESLKDAALATGGNLSNMPLHMADVGSDQYEQEAMLGLVESERRLLREINDALDRLHDGTYGICVESGKPIGKPRLDVTPWAKYTIEVVREKERMGGRR